MKTTLEGEDQDAIQAGLETLAQASMKLGEAMYKATQEAEAAAAEASGDGTEGSGDGPGDGETVVDADFEDVTADARDAADSDAKEDASETDNKDKPS